MTEINILNQFTRKSHSPPPPPVHISTISMIRSHSFSNWLETELSHCWLSKRHVSESENQILDMWLVEMVISTNHKPMIWYGRFMMNVSSENNNSWPTCHDTMTPPPSSMAPTPTSQLSMWPPKITNCGMKNMLK